MWQSIQSVSGWVSLAAFIVAGIVTVVGIYMRQDSKKTRLAPEAESSDPQELVAIKQNEAKSNRFNLVARVTGTIAIIFALVAATGILFPAGLTRPTASLSDNKTQQKQNHTADQTAASTTVPTSPALPTSSNEALLKNLAQFADLQDWGPGGEAEGKTIRIRGWQLPQDWPGPRRIVIEQDGSEEDHTNGQSGQIRSIMFCPETAATCRTLDMRSSQFDGHFDKTLPWNGNLFRVEIQGSPTDIPGLLLRITSVPER